MKKSIFQTVIFAIISVRLNGHTCQFFKNIFNDVQTKDNGEITTAEHKSWIRPNEVVVKVGLRLRWLHVSFS